MHCFFKYLFLNLTLTSSSIHNDSIVFNSYSDLDTGTFWLGEITGDKYGVERYFEYTDDIDIYGIDSEDVLLNLIGYNTIDIVEVRGIYEYDEVVLTEGIDFTISGNDYEITITGPTTLDNYSDLIISYRVELEESKVKTWTFSESAGFEFSEILFNTDTTPLRLDSNNYLGTFYSKFNESYSLTNTATNLNIGFAGITLDDVEIYSIYDMQGQPIVDTYTLIINGNQVNIDFTLTTEDVYIEYGIASYNLSRGYQQIEMNMTDSVRKLSKFHNFHKIYK